MSAIEVEALDSFDHGGMRRRHDRFTVSTIIATKLAEKGLVKVIGEQNENPTDPAGIPSSASPAVPASPQTTAKPSGNGGRKVKKDKSGE